jgi:hypothetical protein
VDRSGALPFLYLVGVIYLGNVAGVAKCAFKIGDYQTCVMSMADIIEELPKLTPEQRAMILSRVRELDGPEESLFLQEAAETMFRDMDQQEGAESPITAVRASIMADAIGKK